MPTEYSFEYNPEEDAKKALHKQIDVTMNQFIDTRFIKGSDLSFDEKKKYHHLLEETTTRKRKGLELVVAMPNHKSSKSEYMPSGNVIFFNSSSRMSPLMFNPKKTSEMMLSFKIQTPIIHKEMNNPKFREFINNTTKQYNDKDINEENQIGLETYGLSTEWLNDYKSNPPTLDIKNLYTMKDKKSWVGTLGSGSAHKLSLKFTDTDVYIMVFANAEKSSREFHRIVQWYAKKYPKMTLSDFMEKQPWHKLHEWNCYRNATRLAYNFAVSIKASIKHESDRQGYLQSSFESCLPKMGIPSTKQEVNCMVKMRGIKPHKYIKYLDDLSYGKTMSCSDSMKYFDDKSNCYVYFNDCTVNHLYHPKSREFVNDIFSSVCSLEKTDENNKLQQKYIESHSNNNIPLYQQKMIMTGDSLSLYESITIDEKLTLNNKSLKSNAPGFIAFPCFSNKKTTPPPPSSLPNKFGKKNTMGNSFLLELNKNKQIKSESPKDEKHFILHNGNDHKFAGKDVFHDIKNVKPTLKSMGFLNGLYEITEMKPYLTKYSNEIKN